MNLSQRSKGFTLIEMLVVISIIGMLSSTLIVSLSKVRLRAHNSVVNQEIDQYRKALELYRVSKGTYPVLEDDNWYCLGSGYPNNKCGHDTNPYSNSPLLDAALRPYITLFPIDKTPVHFLALDPENSGFTGDDNFTGAIYACQPNGNNGCTTVSIEWVISGTSDTCTVSDAIGIIGTDSVLCFLPLVKAVNPAP